MAGRAHCIGGGATVEVKLRKCLLNVLWHLGDYVFLLRANLTTRASKGEEQNDIDETHDKVTIVAADIHDNAAEYAKEDGYLGNRIKITYRCGEMMFWIVCQMDQLRVVTDNLPFGCSTGLALTSRGCRASSSISRFWT